VTLLPKQHIERLERGQDNHEIHCIAAERLVELHLTFRRGVREAVPSQVFEGSSGVRTTTVRMAVPVCVCVKSVIVVGALRPHHPDLLVRLEDDVIVFLLNVKGIEVVISQIEDSVHTVTGLAAPMPTKDIRRGIVDHPYKSSRHTCHDVLSQVPIPGWRVGMWIKAEGTRWCILIRRRANALGGIVVMAPVIKLSRGIDGVMVADVIT
jgi:hypothetical protein